MIHGTKVISTEEARKLEEQGETLMDNAAEAIVSVIQDRFASVKTVLLLVGRGNNGGDALTVGALLLKKKIRVFAKLVYPENSLSSLCKAQLAKFKKAGGALFSNQPFSLIVDGIVGIGFHGKPDAPMLKAIKWTMSQKKPILAVDLPSGLDGETGNAESAICATLTCSLDLPKIGCFVNQGWNYTGELIHCDIGLSEKALARVKSEALLLQEETLEIPPLVRTRHKYEAGYVLGIGGSFSMPGAAALASLAALRSGAGITRLFTHPDTPRAPFAPEIICAPINLTAIQEEMQRAGALFIGPGFGRGKEEETLLRKLLPHLNKPTVIDGDALFHLSAISPPPGSILTPHHGEMARLLSHPPTLESCRKFSEKHRVSIILKGAPTFIFYPGKLPLIITTGDPGMATAGSGDVLTGICAALLSQKMVEHEALALAVYLHGLAGKLAAESHTSYGMIASDLIDALPKAWKIVLSSLS